MFLIALQPFTDRELTVEAAVINIAAGVTSVAVNGVKERD